MSSEEQEFQMEALRRMEDKLDRLISEFHSVQLATNDRIAGMAIQLRACDDRIATLESANKRNITHQWNWWMALIAGGAALGGIAQAVATFIQCFNH